MRQQQVYQQEQEQQQEQSTKLMFQKINYYGESIKTFLIFSEDLSTTSVIITFVESNSALRRDFD
jgi:uncharacterized FlaG/YvyC family protein